MKTSATTFIKTRQVRISFLAGLDCWLGEMMEETEMGRVAQVVLCAVGCIMSSELEMNHQ